MEPWPFDYIPPEDFFSLAEEDREVLEALTRTFIQEVVRIRLNQSLTAGGGVSFRCRNNEPPHHDVLSTRPD